MSRLLYLLLQCTSCKKTNTPKMFSLAFLTNVYNWPYQLNNDLNEPPTWGKMFLFHLSLFIHLKGAISSFS